MYLTVPLGYCSEYMLSLNIGLTVLSEITRMSEIRRLYSVLLGSIAAARKVDVGHDRYCDVINGVPFSLYLMLIMSNLQYVSILHGYKPIRSESQHQSWDKDIYVMFLQILLIAQY